MLLVGWGVIIGSDSSLFPHAVACGSKGISLLGYLYSFKGYSYMESPAMWGVRFSGNLLILRAGGLHTLAGFSVPTFKGEGLVKISVPAVSGESTPLVGGTLATARRRGNKAGCRV